MSDVVFLELLKTGFWLLALIIVIVFFRKEIRQLMLSVNSFKLAGTTFEFKERKETIRSYVLLAEMFVDVLSRGERIDEQTRLLHPAQVEKLGKFALQYTTEVTAKSWNHELLSNIAYLLLRFGRSKQAVELYEALLKERPDDFLLLVRKALALLTTRVSENVEKAEKIYEKLVARFPEQALAHYNLALAYSLREKDDAAFKEMKIAIDQGYWKEDGEMLNDPLFHHVRTQHPSQFAGLQAHITAVSNQNENS